MEQSHIKMLSLLHLITFLVVCHGAPQSLPAELTPEFFPVAESPLKKPVHSAEYVDFINKLYGHDTSKKPLTLDTLPVNPLRELPEEDFEDHARDKRAIIFRPLFVYRQQQVRRQKLKEKRKQQQPQKSSSSSKPSVIVPANTSHFIVHNNKLYQQYNPYYAPYQYGQRYPYQK
ncbi:uncharacterized protein LOC129804371 [Phlebotomus papatasi]|uniref:Uncharacterized protein n=1 Tax=Phlebotomus papatasi TaxID=29031 RepID=A0A1B0D1L9_PHLPP|nr:uncharacterized protein LOC129804371 [Phlebotomus papatasi]